jgi:hypothetical protein
MNRNASRTSRTISSTLSGLLLQVERAGLDPARLAVAADDVEAVRNRM